MLDYAQAPRPVDESGWPSLFKAAFRNSRNAMVLLDEGRRQVDVNGAYLSLLGYRRAALIGRPIYEFVVDGPVATPQEWAETLMLHHFTGSASFARADGGTVDVQYAGHVEVVTGTRLILFVILRTGRGGERFRRTPAQAPAADDKDISPREVEVVRLIALGHTGPEIAEELGISHHTVRTHARNAMSKVGAHSRAHLVAIALGEGLVLP